MKDIMKAAPWRISRAPKLLVRMKSPGSKLMNTLFKEATTAAVVSGAR